MKRYQFAVDVARAEGTQVWGANANSEEEAWEMIRSGQGDIDYEEVEVTELSWGAPNLINVEEVEP